jgi:hypothetical protein
MALCGFGVKKWNSMLAIKRRIQLNGICDNYKPKDKK